MLEGTGQRVRQRLLVPRHAGQRQYLASREHGHELLQYPRSVEIAAGAEQQEPEVKDFEVRRHVGELLADSIDAGPGRRMKPVGPESGGDLLEDRDRRGGLIAGQGCEEHAEAIGLELLLLIDRRVFRGDR